MPHPLRIGDEPSPGQSAVGIFSMPRSHRGPGRAYLNAKKALARKRVNDFAEALANSKPDDTLCDVSRRCGVSYSTGKTLFRRIRGELGDQAQ